jgi:hypothetical protein
VGPRAIGEYLERMRERYERAKAPTRTALLNEMAAMTGFHRKALIRRMNRPVDARRRPGRKKRGRPRVYGPRVVAALIVVWKAAGYPWSARLKALLPSWLPHARRHIAISEETEQRLRAMSPRQMDRCLGPQKREVRRRLYGRTKPGTLLKHHIPLKTDRWDVEEPGFSEVDLVSHSGDCAEGEFAYSVNLTDIDSAWVETRAVLGKSQVRVQEALAQMRAQLPFRLQGIDSDNGSEFINAHLYRYCQAEGIQFTRGRPYKKDDNAHIEQKNWTHVRKLLGYERYDTVAALDAINDLYADVRLLQNLFLPSVKLVEKTRVGSRLRRTYDAPQTPVDRLLMGGKGDAAKVAALVRQRARLDPFALAARVDRKLERVFCLANQRTRPASAIRQPATGATGQPVQTRVAATRPIDAKTASPGHVEPRALRPPVRAGVSDRLGSKGGRRGLCEATAPVSKRHEERQNPTNRKANSVTRILARR